MSHFKISQIYTKLIFSDDIYKCNITHFQLQATPTHNTNFIFNIKISHSIFCS